MATLDPEPNPGPELPRGQQQQQSPEQAQQPPLRPPQQPEPEPESEPTSESRPHPSDGEPQPHPPPQSPPLPRQAPAIPRPPPPEEQRPGPRATRLQSLFAESLRRTLARLSWDNFAACYPTMAAAAPATLSAVRTQMVDRLEGLCTREFNAIMAGRDVVAKLNELEALIGDAVSRRRRAAGQGEGAGAGSQEPPTPPHLLPPATVLAAHLIPHLAAHHSQLNAKLQTTQALNAKLRGDISRQRAEIDGLLAAAEAACADIDGANDALVGLVDDLAEEARDVDIDMGGGLAASRAMFFASQ